MAILYAFVCENVLLNALDIRSSIVGASQKLSARARSMQSFVLLDAESTDIPAEILFHTMKVCANSSSFDASCIILKPTVLLAETVALPLESHSDISFAVVPLYHDFIYYTLTLFIQL